MARHALRAHELAVSPDWIHASGLSGKPDCCWTATAPETAYPTLEGAHAAEVAIVGAGIVGVTAAYLLSEAGLSVALLEARRIGRQVTGRSTAKITTQHSLIYRHLIKTHNTAEPHRFLSRLPARCDLETRRNSILLFM